MLFAEKVSKKECVHPVVPGGLLVQVDIRQVEPVRAMASLAPGGAVAAAARAAFFALQCAYQPPHGKPHSRRHYRQCYDCLYHNQINKLPIWKKSAETIHASPMV